jgi:hypothetical protein
MCCLFQYTRNTMFASRYRHHQRHGTLPSILPDIPSRRFVSTIDNKSPNTILPWYGKWSSIKRTVEKFISECDQDNVDHDDHITECLPPTNHSRVREELRHRDMDTVSTHVPSVEYTCRLLQHIIKRVPEHGNDFTFIKTIVCILMGKSDMVHIIDTDTCFVCNRTLVHNARQSTKVCTTCAVSRYSLFNVVDTTIDVSIGGSSSIFGISNGVDHHAGTKRSREQCSDSIEPKRRKANTGYNRVSIYKKYLMQFAEDAEDTPKEILDLIYKYLSSVHVMNSIRSKPTPIATILRGNRNTKWSHRSLRITYEINGSAIPKIPHALIDRLTLRFSVVLPIMLQSITKRLSFDCLTGMFLSLELREDLAKHFLSPKTRSVIRTTRERMYAMIPDIIRVSPPDLKWGHLKRGC